MAVHDQPLTSYSDTTPQKRVIADQIDLISPNDAPVVKRFMRDADYFQLTTWPGTKVEWLEDELADWTDTLAASCTSNATTLSVTDGSLHHVGDVLLIDAEKVWVSAISTNTLTVTRNYGGTQASHASDATITRLFNARLEGADASYDRAVADIAAPYNYTQVLQDDLKVTRTQAKLAQYGIADYFDYQASKRMEELVIQMDQAFFYGERKAGSATTPRAFGGIETFVTTNTTSLSGAALDWGDIKDAIQSCWEGAGSSPDLLICNAWVARKISDMFANSVRTERAETIGGVVIKELDTEFGMLGLLMDRWCPKTKLYIVESRYIGFVPFDPFFQEPLAKTGDAIKGQVIGEYTLVVKNNKAHAIISSISTSS